MKVIIINYLIIILKFQLLGQIYIKNTESPNCNVVFNMNYFKVDSVSLMNDKTTNYIFFRDSSELINLYSNFKICESSIIVFSEINFSMIKCWLNSPLKNISKTYIFNSVAFDSKDSTKFDTNYCIESLRFEAWDSRLYPIVTSIISQLDLRIKTGKVDCMYMKEIKNLNTIVFYNCSLSNINELTNCQNLNYVSITSSRVVDNSRLSDDHKFKLYGSVHR